MPVVIALRLIKEESYFFKQTLKVTIIVLKHTKVHA